MDKIKYCIKCGGVASDILTGVDFHSHINKKYCDKCKQEKENKQNRQHCVYWFSHPNHKYLYIGLANGTLRQRIFSHLSGSKYDNIGSQYLNLLRESKIYFAELENFIDTHLVESYLINKYKPIANRQYPNIINEFDESSLKWKEFKDINKALWFQKNIKEIKL